MHGKWLAAGRIHCLHVLISSQAADEYGHKKRQTSSLYSFYCSNSWCFLTQSTFASLYIVLCVQARLYEFIVRSFLATCSKPAVGFETRVEADVAGELFDTRGAQPSMQISRAPHCNHRKAE